MCVSADPSASGPLTVESTGDPVKDRAKKEVRDREGGGGRENKKNERDPVRERDSVDDASAETQARTEQDSRDILLC